MQKNKNVSVNPTGSVDPIPQVNSTPKVLPAEQKTFNTINAATLMAQEFEPLQFAVDKILPHGLFILAGSGKIGKSWLALDICTAVSSGGNLWGFATEQGEVLYLALEDNHQRLQSRLTKIEADDVDISKLYLTTTSFGISTGLLEQTQNFLAAHPDTKMIIVDTLERIRDTELDKSMYSCDYRDMTKLREITDKHKLTLLLIHHTRKMYDPDPLNTLSGSTGLVGSVDGVFVLEKARRTGTDAKLTIANRDTEDFCFKLKFDGEVCKWSFVGSTDELAEERDEWLCLLVDDFLQQDSWSGTATELSDALKKIDPEADVTKLNIKKQLRNCIPSLKKDFSIDIDLDGRDSKRRAIVLTRLRGDAA